MARRKEFYQHWSDQEIKDYVKCFNVLVLFVIHASLGEAEIIVHGNITDEQKRQLTIVITTLFGGSNMDKSLCNKVNEFAEKWYSKIILKKKARVINFRKETK
jgi:hypothetical protein